MIFVPPPSTLNLATWISCTSAEGPGKRFALWVQGCAIRCPHCCNPEMFGFAPRQVKSIDEILQMILDARDEHGIEGITCLGGEPFSQATSLSVLAEKVRREGLSVMVFTGFVLEDLQNNDDSGIRDLLSVCDLLVDGPYIEEKKTLKRRWIGSTNQRVHFLTGRYKMDKEEWTKPNAVEISFDGKELQISGFPLWEKQLQAWKKIIEKRNETPPKPSK